MILQRFLATSGSGSVSDLLNPQLWLVDAMGGGATSAGVKVTPQTAMGLSAYFAAIRAISEDVGKLPLIVYRQLDPRGKDRLRDHPAYDLLHTAPNDWMSAITFRETLTAWALGWGNGYAEIQRDRGVRGAPKRLLPLHPKCVTVRQTDKGTIYYEYRYGATQKTIPAEAMLHLHGLGDDGIQGYSVATIGAESMGLSLAAQTFGAAFFGNGSSMGGVLKHPEVLSEKALQHLRDTWSSLYTGAYNAGKPAILEEGMTWERIGIPPDDAQFLETRQLQVEEIARWFRIPPHKIQHLLRATFSNIESQNIEYVVDTLTPWLVRWEQELKRKLFAEEDDVFAEHVVAGLLRGDHAARGVYYREQFFIGALSQNDIRELENRNPIGPDGDVYYVPSNMTRSEDAAQGLVASATAMDPEAEDEDEDEEEDSDEKEESPTGVKPPEPPGKQAVREALQPCIAAETAGLLRKETRASARASQRSKGEPAEFSQWMDEFWAEQRVQIVQQLMPLAMAYASLAGSTLRVPEIVHAWAAAWECESKPALLTAHKLDRVDKVIQEWTPQRQTALSTRLLDALAND